MNKNLIKVISLLLILTVALAGCGGAGGGSSPAGGGSTPAGDGSTAAGGETPAPSGTGKDSVVVEIVSDPDGLCGQFRASTVVNLVSDQIFDTLIRAEADGSFSPRLATSWEMVDDKDYVFEIRPDVKFHNGDVLTVDDVVYTFDKTIEAGFAATATSNISHAEKVDDTHVKIVFKTPYGPALTVLSNGSLGIFSKNAHETAGHDTFLRNPVGTGPYQFSSWKSGDSINLVRFDDHWAGQAPIKDLTFRIFLDSSVAAIALENGEIDVLTNPMQTDRNLLMNNSNVEYKECPSNMVTWAYFLSDAPRFNDQRLREAFSYAIDRESVLLGAMEGVGVPVNSMFPNHMPLAAPGYVPRGYDKEKAIALLAECGYGPENPLVIHVQTSQNPNYVKPFEVMQAQLAEVSVQMTIEPMESGAWFMDVLQAQNYEFNLMPTTIAYLDCDERYALFHSGEPQNNFGVADPELDRAFEINRTSTDIEERRQASYDIIRIMDEKAYVIPLYGNMRAIAYNPGLQGVEPSPGYLYHVFDWSWA